MTDLPTFQLPSFVRELVKVYATKALTAASASLITLGVLPDDQTTQFVTVGSGLLLGLASILWSWAATRLNQNRIAHAAAAPASVAVDHAGTVIAAPPGSPRSPP